jgi:type II secretory pathway pseudopilin PulG
MPPLESQNKISGSAAQSGAAQQKKQRRRGESLVEILVAFLMLATTSGAATILITQSARTSEAVRQRVIAESLAREGLEAFNAFRNTNWLKFQDKKSCWDVTESTTKCPSVGAQKIVSSGATNPQYFILSTEINSMRQTFEFIGSDDGTKLDLQNATNQQNSPYAIYEADNSTSKGVLVNFTKAAPPPADQKPVFYRMITIQRAPENPDNIIKVTSGVEWKSAGNISKATLSSYFTNY